MPGGPSLDSLLPEHLLLDGGVGTSLLARGLDVESEPPESWNLSHPEVVQAIHRGFIEAGSGALQTNTFGANRLRLARHGRQDEVRVLNVEGALLARSVAGDRLVIGCLGPTGAVPPPQGNADLFELEDSFAEQAGALADGGVDFLHVETMYHPKEVRAALRGCRDGAPDLPVVVSMACVAVGESYKTPMSFPAESLLAVALEESADGIGANCAIVPADMLDLIRLIASRAGVPIFAKPTVAPDGGAPLYPAEFATGVQALFAVGARAVGGCCATGPADLAAAREAMAGVRRTAS